MIFVGGELSRIKGRGGRKVDRVIVSREGTKENRTEKERGGFERRKEGGSE